MRPSLPNSMNEKAGNAMLRFFAQLLLPVFFGLAIPGLNAQDRYVNPDGICGGNTPCYTTIQAAIDAAVPSDVIVVAAGTYPESINLNKAVTIQGANASIAAGANPGARGAETIIDGGFIVSAAATLDGLNIINGRLSGSVKVGVAVATSDVTILNCIIEDVGMLPLPTSQSDGISTQTGNNNLTLTNSTIQNNWRGIYLNPGDGHVFTGNLIDANNGVGVGIGSDGQSNFTLTGNIISNHTLEGWGASSVGANVVAEDNQFLNNGVSVAHYGGQPIDAAPNYWGSATPDFNVVVSGTVTYDPWWGDAAMTMLETGNPVLNITQSTSYSTIEDAVVAANTDDVIHIQGVLTLTTNIILNKKLTLDGLDKTTTTVRGDNTLPSVGGGKYFILISGAGSGSTIQNITFEKLDKAGPQNMIGLQTTNVTFDNCDFTGQYVLGDPDVSRAFEVSGSATGFVIQNCSITSLRQPAYFNPGSSGQVLNTYVDETRGWVVDGAIVTFSGNSWGTNAVDIALLAGTILGTPYDPLTTLSANNNGATFSDQRGYAAYNVTQSTTHASIQAAVDAAVSGDLIQVASGTFNETVVVNQQVTIEGAGQGSSPSSNTVLTASTACSGTAFTISANDVTLKNMYIKDYNVGVQIGAVSNPTVEDVTIEDHCTYGISLAGSLSQNVSILGTTINRTGSPGTTVGIRAGTASGVDGLMVDGCTITNNNQGFSIFQASSPAPFDNITIQNSTISNNAIKGMYFEKLRNALLKNLTMDNNGTDAAYGFNTGIDINLKYDDYSNITIEGCDITNSGATGTATDPENPAAVAIKARDDAPSYSGNPATLTNVVLKNNRITSPNNGIRFGEFGKVNATPTNITLEKNDLAYAFGHKAIISRVDGDVELDCNWHGTTDVPTITSGFVTAGSGSINLNQFLNAGTDPDPASGFQPSGTCQCPSGLLVTNTTTTETFCSIQAAINDSDTQDGHTLEVAPGDYTEAGQIVISKNLTITGTGTDCDDVIIRPNANTGNSGDARGWWLVQPGKVLNLNKLTLDGNGYLVHQAIRQKGSGNVDQVCFKNIKYNESGPDYNGIAIAAFGSDPGSNVNVTNSTFEEIGRVGVLYFGTGVDGSNYSNNTYTGKGAGDWLDYALDISAGAVVTVSNNTITNCLGVASSGGSISSGVLVTTYFGAGTTATFTGNTITGNTIGINIGYDNTDGSIVTANNNDLSGNTDGGMSNTNPANEADAQLNWWGSAAGPYPIDEGIDYCQWLDAPPPGGSPVGSVQNMTTSAYYCTIQDAIDAATPGDVIEVAAGLYKENVVVNKSVTLNGPNADIACGAGRVTEATVAPASGLPFSVTADGVTINGFEITAPSYPNAIVCGGTSNLTIEFNNIHDVGTTVSGSHVHSINYTVPNAPGADSDVTISDNCFDNINNPDNHQRSASAIGFLQSTTTGTLTNLNIERNTITDVYAKTADWSSGGRIAYGIILNAGSANYLTTDGKIVNAVIRDNEISNLSGFISTGIGLEGNTENAVVENNSVSYLYGRKVDVRSGGGYDLSALKFESNRYVATVTVENNSFQTNTFTHDVTPGLGYAVSNYVPVGDAYTGGTTGPAALKCNWFGTSVYSEIEDNPALDGKVFNKDLCETEFLPYLVDGTDDEPLIVGFQPVANACTGCPGGVLVTNTNTGETYCSIQDGIDDATSGDRLAVITGTYAEDVDATAKDITFAPGSSPGCVTITGNMTLNAGDELEIEINGTTPCDDHDQFIVSGTVDLGGADLVLPAGLYLATLGDQIVIIDGSNPIVGQFAQGNFATDGNNYYYINYEGGDGNDVVLTKCCTGLLDLGIFNHTASSPVGNKLQVRVRPKMDVYNGAYTSGVFTIRTLSTNAVSFTTLSAPIGYSLIASGTDAGYDYFVFYYENGDPNPVNWLENTAYELITLGYDCIADATFELVDDAFAASLGGAFYQELGGQEAQDGFYSTSAISPPAVSITASSNSPVCQTMEIDLNSSTLDGTSPYTYAWDGPDSYSSTDANPAPFTALLTSAGTYGVTVTDANGCSASASTVVEVPATGACVENIDTDLYYPTITQAIDATETLNGHTLEVPAGTWTENVIVNKELTINGPNALIDPCTGSRVAEAIVVPAVSDIEDGEIFHVEASNVTIAGFTIDGDNTVITSGFTSTNGADIDASDGVTIYVDNVNNLTVTNNIFQNLSFFAVSLYGASFSAPATSGHTIAYNKMQDLGTYDATSGVANWGGGVLLYNNQYARVVNNCMTNVRIGLQTGNFSKANPGAASFQVVDNNTMEVRRRGIFHNLAYGPASAYTLSNNAITGLLNANETVWDGILLASLSVPSTSTDNTIDGTGITNPSEGYEVWNVDAATPADIGGGSVSNVDIGLFVNNYEGYNSNGGDGAHATVANLSITPNALGTGIRLHDNPSSTGANVQLTIGAGVTVTNGTTGLLVERPAASIVGGTLNDLSFSGTSGNYIELIDNTGDLDGTSASFDGNTGATATLTQNFAIEDKIVHATDDLALGFVRVKATEVFVTPLSGSVQRGVDVADVGDIVNVANGTYNEDVNVNKAVTVDGESHSAIIRGLYVAGLGHSVLLSSNSTLKDVTVTRDYGATEAEWYACPKNQGVTIKNGSTGVTIDNVVITGNRNGLYINNAQNFTVINSTIEDNRTGIQLVNNVSGGLITNNFIRNNFTLGVLYNVFGGTNFIGTNFQLNDNDISGNWYGQVVFHDNGTGGTVGDLTGFNNNCNWYGVTYPAYAAIPAGEPGYASQQPSQFGGTDPGLNQDIVGTLAHLITYIPFLTDGTDDDLVAAGFQPVAGACNGLGIVLNETQNLTYPTIQLAVNDADPNDVISAPAGTYPENVNVTESVLLKGANYGIAGCSGRGPETIVSGGGGTAVTISANGVILDGFQLDGHTGVSVTSYNDVVIQNNKINAQVLGIGAQNVATTPINVFTIQGNCIDLLTQAYEAFPFSTDPVLASSQTPGTWYTDRYAPAGFVRESFGGNDRLKHSISAADCQSCRPGGFSSSFYNTQGRKYDITGATAMSIQLYVPTSWASTGRRMAGFWGTAFDNLNDISFYPIIEFSSEGGVPQFRAWNGTGWVVMGLPTGFAYNQWYTLSIALEGGNIVYQVGNLKLSISSPTSVSIGNVILQGHNTDTPGVTYDIYWDNLQTYGSPAATANNPTIGILLAGAAGTDDVTIDNNSISDAFYGYLLAGVTTTPRTTVRGGTYTNLMQGVAVVNTLDEVAYLSSTVGVEDLSFTSFAGNYPALPDFNFHAGVYVFTGGPDPSPLPVPAVDILVDNVIVSNTGKTSQASAGLYFADFSTGTAPRLNAVVTNSVISNNLNRGVEIRGDNATATVSYCDILYNGSDPYGDGGNDGFGVYAGVGSSINLQNNRIINPAAQIGAYPVTAIFNGVSPASTIVANNNLIDDNGNGEVTHNPYDISDFDATCNWWGTAWIDAIDALVEGNVLFIPYLNDGTDNSTAVGFQTTAPCVDPTHWFVNDEVQTGDVYTLGIGDDLNQGTKRRPFRTIGMAITAVASADTIYVDAGNYDEQAVVPNTLDNLLFLGAGPTTIVDFTGTVSGNPTLFNISGDGTIIDGFRFDVDVSILNSAIIATDPPAGTLNSITIQNNTINPYQSVPGTYFGSYGNRNAISINYGIYRVSSGGGVDDILVDNNIVTATVNGPILGDDPGDVAFRSAVSVDEGAGTYTRNTFQSINQDVLVRFNNNGPVVIGGSVADANTFTGGGVQYSDPNAGGGAVTISHNAFDGSVSGSVLRLQNNYHNAAVTVSDNTFSNLRWGMSIENFPDVTVTDNTFSPLAGFTSFRHITVNTKSLSTNSSGIVQVPINGVFTGNTFNSLTPTTGGIAMAFYNHDSNDATLGTFTVGTVGDENVFAKDFAYAVYLGNQTGPTYPAPGDFPEYDLTSGSNTTMACWDQDIDIQNNTFDVGSGAQLPSVMNHTQRLALEDILFHLPDNPCLGELIYFPTVLVNAKVILQGPYDSVSGLMSDALRTQSLIPTTEPYSTVNTAHPGSFAEVNNFVVEDIDLSVLNDQASEADDIVDWVWVELRSDTTTVQATRTALVQRDGDIVDLDGTSYVEFPDSYLGDEYYLMVRHRNHLGAMTAAKVDFTGAPLIDFTSPSLTTYGTTATSARRLVKTNTLGLWAGNTRPLSAGIFEIKYNGTSNDRAPILLVVSPPPANTPLNVVSNVYMLEDVNMNGQVKYTGSGNDRVIILNNVGPSTPLNIVKQQPQN